ncbi:TetR/AcrR family transcriptional regulator [Streptomyces viridochromogenes]|uniref:Putative HTH-type transcriptional regulator n=1 Tax=Streptomyces viridochromogenes Tue57 TaxID=1160705 RepID=L8P0M6_STRVR|nr:TetR/AcrR family transcriptional regulator [Streptomyces viridochromogenes]ELS51121.1 putative HTH-type transcriptional regulator [Streptomyces viridochromogenes Tue57]
MRADAARNYERIVSAAVLAFEEIGPEVTLEQIATRAEVNVATVYRRFRARDQLVRAVLDHVLTLEVEPLTAVETDDPWRDLTGVLEAVVEVLARRRVIHSLAVDFEAFDVDSAHRFLSSMERLLRRAVDAGAARPELEARDLAAVITMNLATVHPADPNGTARRRFLALLIDGLRPSPTPLPPAKD